MANPKKPLTAKQAVFAQEMAKDGNVHRSAKAAGYKKPNSSEMMKSPSVKAVIDEARQQLQTAANFNAQAAFEACEKAIQFAINTNNANAYAKLIELQMKMSGHLVEKIDIRGQLAPMFIQIEGLAPVKPDDVESEVQ